MTQNENLINTFYTCFQNKDFRGMQACYADNAVFSDCIFQKLNSSQVRSMWEMFCKNGKIVEHSDSFNFYKWASQSLGITGLLIGWTSLIKNKIRNTAMKNLTAFMNKK